MIDGGVAVIRLQVLLRYVGRMLRSVDQYVVPGFVLGRTRSCNGLVPLFGRLKIRINVHDYAAILKESVMDQIAIPQPIGRLRMPSERLARDKGYSYP